MPHLNLTMTQAGPLVEVWAAVSQPHRDALIKAGKPVPPAVKIRGLVDTGASCTAVDPSIIQKLQVPVTGTASVRTPSTGAVPHVCNQYAVLLAIIDAKGNALYHGGSVPVLESSLAEQGIEALIGRDILADGILIYNGAAGTFTLSY